MSKYMEQIYDKYIAEEKLKTGSKYERIAAVVYKALDNESLILHDMRLRGVGKDALHQIDITIEKKGKTKRILVECKDYSQFIGIGIIRDFFGAISQIKPDEAIVVTTKGYTKGAINFAKDEDIKLAVLRKFEARDWEGKLRKLILNIKMIFMDTPKITWVAANEIEKERAEEILKNDLGKIIEVDTQESYFYNEMGLDIGTLQSILQPIFNTLPRIEGEIKKGRYEFGQIYYILMCGVKIAVKGFDYEYTSYATEMENTIDDGGKLAVLLYSIMDESDDKILFDKDLEIWTFDENGEVTLKQ